VIHLLPVLTAAVLAAAPVETAPVSADIAVAPSPPIAPALPPPAHAFWDWPNVGLFSGVAAARAFDFVSTRQFRQKHLKEWLLDDKTVDNRPLFLTIEIAGTALSIGASYLLHRLGHHRLERWASILHIGAATAGGLWNLTLPNGL
jgi:hypothetical protein